MNDAKKYKGVQLSKHDIMLQCVEELLHELICGREGRREG